MSLTSRLHCLTLAAITLIAAFSVSGQRPGPTFDRERTFDVQHYVLRVSFDRNKKMVLGDTTVELVPLSDGLTAVELDAVGLNFESVVDGVTAAALKYTKTATKVNVVLERPAAKNESISIRFKYSAAPKMGVYFVDGDLPKRSAQIWTQGEAEEARHWFPSFDFPSDKATSEQIITAQKGETVIGNGELIRRTENPDGSETWHYKMPVPHSTYLTSFVIGQYLRVADKYKEIPLGYYVYPGRERLAANAFGDTKRMMAVFEKATGIAYPFNKYDQTMVAKFQFGGMENITATTLSESEIYLAEDGPGERMVIDLVSHELAHSWFGNLVTCRNWAELWLNEGFATYMEAVYREAAYGREEYMDKIRSDAAEFIVDDSVNKRRHGLYNTRAGDVEKLFDNSATTYHKGGAIIHTLREQLGIENFWKGVKLYLERRKFDSVETADLRKAMEEASGQKLDWFFDQWVYGTGSPRIEVTPTYDRAKKKLIVRIDQTQTVDGTTPEVFRLPLDLVIRTGRSFDPEQIELTKRSQTFTFPAPAKPTSVEVDNAFKIPVKRLKVNSVRQAPAR